MDQEHRPTEEAPAAAPEAMDRREALRRFGKYAAVTAPALLVVLGGKKAFAQSGPPPFQCPPVCT